MAIHFYLNTRTGYPPSRPVSVRLVVRRHRGHSLTVTLPAPRVEPRTWSVSRERLKGSAPGATDLNRRLEDIKTTAQVLLLDGHDDQELRTRLLALVGRRTPDSESQEPSTILGLFGRFIDHKSVRARASTLRTYRGLEKHLEGFVRNGAKPGTIGPAWMDDFSTHLLETELANSTINKLLSRTSGFLDWLKLRGHISAVPEAPKLSTARNDAIYLTRGELSRLGEVDLSDQSDGLRAARDLFLAASVTGQRYSDLSSMEWDDVAGEGEQQVWNFHVRKTSVTLRVPLIGPAREIVDRRRERGDARPMPKLTNQAANRYIKEACRIAEIDAPVSEVHLFGKERRVVKRAKHDAITMHASRKTFITLGMESGALEAEDFLGFTHDDMRQLSTYKGRDDAALRVKLRSAFGGLRLAQSDS